MAQKMDSLPMTPMGFIISIIIIIITSSSSNSRRGCANRGISNMINRNDLW